MLQIVIFLTGKFKVFIVTAMHCRLLREIKQGGRSNLFDEN